MMPSDVGVGNGMFCRFKDGKFIVYKGVPGGIPERRATPADVSPRNDLRADHPFRGRRMLKIVPSGMPDCEIDNDGLLVPLDNDGNPRETENG
jgi:hypothetical protein